MDTLSFDEMLTELDITHEELDRFNEMMEELDLTYDELRILLAELDY